MKPETDVILATEEMVRTYMIAGVTAADIFADEDVRGVVAQYDQEIDR